MFGAFEKLLKVIDGFTDEIAACGSRGNTGEGLTVWINDGIRVAGVAMAWPWVFGVQNPHERGQNSRIIFSKKNEWHRSSHRQQRVVLSMQAKLKNWEWHDIMVTKIRLVYFGVFVS